MAAQARAVAVVGLDQREADEPLAAGAEADARRHRDPRPLEQLGRELRPRPGGGAAAGSGAQTNIDATGSGDRPAGRRAARCTAASARCL